MLLYSTARKVKSWTIKHLYKKRCQNNITEEKTFPAISTITTLRYFLVVDHKHSLHTVCKINKKMRLTESKFNTMRTESIHPPREVLLFIQLEFYIFIKQV